MSESVVPDRVERVVLEGLLGNRRHDPGIPGNETLVRCDRVAIQHSHHLCKIWRKPHSPESMRVEQSKGGDEVERLQNPMMGHSPHDLGFRIQGSGFRVQDLQDMTEQRSSPPPRN